MARPHCYASIVHVAPRLASGWPGCEWTASQPMRCISYVCCATLSRARLSSWRQVRHRSIDLRPCRICSGCCPASREPLVLVVDNFETAAVPDFEAVFAQVVRTLPERVQLCVGTRVVPTARLARLQIREGTVVISNEELCFRPAENPVLLFRVLAIATGGRGADSRAYRRLACGPAGH